MPLKIRKTLRQALKAARKAISYAELSLSANLSDKDIRALQKEYSDARRSLSGVAFLDFVDAKQRQQVVKAKEDLARFKETLADDTERALFVDSARYIPQPKLLQRATRLTKLFQLFVSKDIDPYLANIRGFKSREEYLAKVEKTREDLKDRIALLQDKEDELSRIWFKSAANRKDLLDTVLMKETLQLALFWDRFERQYNIESGEYYIRKTLYQKMTNSLAGGIVNVEGVCAVNAPVVAILNLKSLPHLVSDKTDPFSMAFRQMHGSSLIEQFFSIQPLRDLIGALRNVRGAIGGSRGNVVFQELVDRWPGLQAATLGSATFAGVQVDSSLQILMKLDPNAVTLDELFNANQFHLVKAPRVLVLSIWQWPTTIVEKALFKPEHSGRRSNRPSQEGYVQRLLRLLPVEDIKKKCRRSILTFILSKSSTMSQRIQSFCNTCLKPQFKIAIDLDKDSLLEIASKIIAATGRGNDVIEDIKSVELPPEIHMKGTFNVDYPQVLTMDGFNYTLRATTESPEGHTYTIAWLDEGCFEVNDEFRRDVQCIARNTTSMLYYELNEPEPIKSICMATEVLDRQLNECMDRTLLDSFIRNTTDYKKIQASAEYFGTTKLRGQLVQLGGADLSQDDRSKLRPILADLSVMAENEAVALKLPTRKRKETISIQLLKKLQVLSADERATFFQVVDKDKLKNIDWKTVNSICYEDDNCYLLGCAKGFFRGSDGECVAQSLMQKWGPTTAALATAGITSAIALPKLLRSIHITVNTSPAKSTHTWVYILIFLAVALALGLVFFVRR